MESLLDKVPEATSRANTFGFTREITLLYAAISAVLLVLFGIFTSYDNSEITGVANSSTTPSGSSISLLDSARFSQFQSVHLFVFVGFGFLTSYLCHGQLIATGHSLIVGTFATFFALLCRAFFASAPTCIALAVNSTCYKVTPAVLNIGSLVEADYAAAAVLISFGAVLGRVTIPQLLAMGLLEVIFYTFNEGRLNSMGVADVGGSVTIFSFGAYFGLCVSLFCLAGGRDEHKARHYNKSSDVTNALSMLGTLFMFVYFPSFNSAAANSQASMTRSVVNTYLALTTSVITTVFIELFTNNKIHPWKIQRATLAGGIVIGSVANTMFTPFRAGLAGVIGAFVVHFGAEYATPFLRNSLRVSEDTIGVNHVFGLTGLTGGILSMFAAATATANNYGQSLTELNSVFPKMGFDMSNEGLGPRPRSAQVIAQIAGIIITMTVAIVGGIITGIVLRYIPDPVVLYHDADSYRVQDVPDTTPSPEQQSQLQKKTEKAARKKLLSEARAACREAFAKKDPVASKKAHKMELELEKAGIRKKLFAKKSHDGDENENELEMAQVDGAGNKSPATSSSSSSSSGSGSDSDDDDFLIHAEPHSEIGGDTSKTIVFGALDGIMTTFAVVTAAAGGNQDWKIVVSYGFAHLLADAFSMGFGDYIGSKAELDKARAEHEREVWETENNIEGEIKEMTDIYVCRGFDREDAHALVKIHAKDKDRFVDFMMKEELEIDCDLDDDWGPIEGSLVMFFSFITFGAVSLIPYLSQRGRGVDGVFFTSCALVGLALLGLGALKGTLTGLPIARTAISMLLSGILSGGISYVIGVIVAGKLVSAMGGSVDSASWA